MEEFEHLKIQLEEIKRATNSFSSRFIGEGRFGAVYEGVVSHARGRSIVAIKRLDRQFGQGEVEFSTEIMLLSRYRHQNVISLLGYCDEGEEKVLVYEFASKLSLDRHLSDPDLTWVQRIKICLGAAKGLSYLHDPKGRHYQRVLHCDIKSSNIFLDESLTAKVGDFGLSKLALAYEQDSVLVTGAVGTPGYCDPLFLTTQTLTKESDVYCFGVVLFEVLCGRLCYEYNNGQSMVLVNMWKEKYSENKLNEIVFQHLKPQIDPTSLELFSNVAFQCLHDSREGRPTMSIVVEKLEKTLEFQELPEGYQEILNAANPIVTSSSSSSKIPAFIKESKDLFIPFQVIEKATNNFTTVLGKGGYGFVYKGELLLSGELTSVAVKRLDSNISGQGFKEFLTEIQLLSRYKHPNVVSLLGFCDEAGERILVYEYAEHGSLDKQLSVAKTTRPLTWEQRIRICLDTARGLSYLHNHIATNHRVIHRDIKSANILIRHDWKAMIADLGLSKIGRANEGDSFLITNASGTPGYCDPAYMHTGILTKESDVYSFGVVMFEVLCGRLGFMNVNNEHRFLAPLAQRYYETGRLNEIIDPYLKIEVDFDSLKKFSEIAYPCLLNERERRPSMGLVVQKLEEMMASSKILQMNLKLAAQGSSKDPYSSKHGPKKGNSLSRYGNSHEAYNVLGHKTDNIRDIYTFGKKLREFEFGTIYLVFFSFSFLAYLVYFSYFFFLVYFGLRLASKLLALCFYPALAIWFFFFSVLSLYLGFYFLIFCKTVAQGSSKERSSSKPLHGPKKRNSLRSYGNFNLADIRVLGLRFLLALFFVILLNTHEEGSSGFEQGDIIFWWACLLYTLSFF